MVVGAHEQQLQLANHNTKSWPDSSAALKKRGF